MNIHSSKHAGPLAANLYLGNELNHALTHTDSNPSRIEEVCNRILSYATVQGEIIPSRIKECIPDCGWRVLERSMIHSPSSDAVIITVITMRYSRLDQIIHSGHTNYSEAIYQGLKRRADLLQGEAQVHYSWLERGGANLIASVFLKHGTPQEQHEISRKLIARANREHAASEVCLEAWQLLNSQTLKDKHRVSRAALAMKQGLTPLQTARMLRRL